jgi:predicted metal-binding protein
MRLNNASREPRRNSTRVQGRTPPGATRVPLIDIGHDTDAEGCTSMAILVCITCRRADDPEDAPRPGAALAVATAVAAEGTGVAVKRVRCLANCKRGLSAAVRRSNGWTYVFGDLVAETDAEALVAGAQLLADATDGLMPWRGRPPVLKRGLIARVPPLDFEDLE